MSREDVLLGLVGSIYDAVGEPARWDSFLTDLANLIGGVTTSLILFDLNSREGNAINSVRIDPESMRRFNEYYIGIDQWAMHGHQHFISGSVNLGQKMCPDEVLRRSEFYDDFLRPQGLFNQVNGIIATDGPNCSVISSCRGEGAGPFEAEQLQVLRLLMPHLQQALVLHRRIGALETRVASQLDLLDRLDCGLIVISNTNVVLTINAHARSIFDARDGLRCASTGLAAARLSDTRRLQHLIKYAQVTSSGKGTHAGGVLHLPRPSGLRGYQLSICPYRPSHPWPGAVQPAVLVFINDPERIVTPPALTLSNLYGLTPAEARLASLLAAGTEFSRAIEQLGISKHTGRTHLKRIFDKTGTRRQSEFIHRVLTGVARVVLDEHGMP